jgi:hypothetical protein
MRALLMLAVRVPSFPAMTSPFPVPTAAPHRSDPHAATQGVGLRDMETRTQDSLRKLNT